MSLLRQPHARLLLLALLVMGGAVACGQSDSADTPVAEVGERVITLDYFQRKMNTMDPKFVPKNIDTVEGRLELLETMINKEVMAIKAEELGFAEDEQVTQMAEAVSVYNAVALMKADVTKDSREVTEEEIHNYFENFQRALDVSYMLFDREDGAIEGRRLVAGGEDWFDVAERISVGPPGDSGNYTLRIKYGTLADDLEKVVFALEVGEISQPINTIYGWFIVRLDGQSMERTESMEDLRPRIVASIQKQKSDLATKDFIEEVFGVYNFTLDDEVVQLVFDSFPEDWPMMPPPDRADLQSLNLQPADLDRVLMSYADETWTVRRFQDFYDELHALGRPRREQRLGGFRRRLEEIAVRDLMPLAAADREYTDRPEVKEQYKERREQAMVTQLHAAMVQDMVRVSPEEVDTYWAEHKDKYYKPERRDVRGLVAAAAADAEAALVEARKDEVDWAALVARYGAPGASPENGKVGIVAASDDSPWAKWAFSAYGVGDVVGPNGFGDGQFAIAKVVEVLEERIPVLDELRVQVGNEIKSQKEEELFLQRVEEWKAGMQIQRYPDTLEKAVLERDLEEIATVSTTEGSDG